MVSEDASTTPPISSGHAIGGSGGPPNRPLPPTPDDDDQAGDRTLIMKRVSKILNFSLILIYFNYIRNFELEEGEIGIVKMHLGLFTIKKKTSANL